MPNRPQTRLLQVLFLAGAGLWLRAHPRRPKRSLLWSALFFAADLIAIPAILRAKPRISGRELAQLQPEAIPFHDRLAIELPVEHRAEFQKTSDRLLRVAVALPALLLLNAMGRRSAACWLQDYVWGHALTYTIYTFSPLGPAWSDKYRPVVYRNEVALAERTNGNNRNSQYSGHTGNAAFAGFFLARQLAAVFRLPSCVAPAIAAVPALLVGGLRIRAQKHFPSDVLLATGIGGIIAGALSKRDSP